MDRDSHVWNTNIAGVRGYLAPRLRGERGETRVKFADDVSAFWRNGDGLGAPSPTSGSTTPHVRYGDALWLVTCPASRGDPTDPGGGRPARGGEPNAAFETRRRVGRRRDRGDDVAATTLRRYRDAACNAAATTPPRRRRRRDAAAKIGPGVRFPAQAAAAGRRNTS